MNHLIKRFVIGRLGKPRGLNGELRVFPLTDKIERFNNLKSCYLENEDGKIQMELKIASSRIVHQQISLTFDLIDTREKANQIKGLYLSVDRSDAISLPEDSYFIPDLIGCQVYDNLFGFLGKISDIQKHANADVVIVSAKDKKDLLYPNLKSIVQKVDLEKRRIDIKLPNGLYEIYR